MMMKVFVACIIGAVADAAWTLPEFTTYAVCNAPCANADSKQVLQTAELGSTMVSTLDTPLAPGCYESASAFGLTGTVYVAGDANDYYVFRTAGAMTTAALR